MKIIIKDLTFAALIGVYQHERVQPQPLKVNAEINYQREGEYLNYMEVVKAIQDFLIEQKFKTLENAIVSTTNFLHQKFPVIKKVRLQIIKPAVLPNGEVGVEEVMEF